MKEKRSWPALLLLFLILAAGLVAVGNFSYRNFSKKFRLEVERQLSSIAELKVDQLAQWRKERLMDASILDRNPAFSELASRFLRVPADAGAQGGLLLWMEKYPDNFQYDRIRLLDPQGVTRLSVPSKIPPESSAVLRLLPEVLQSGRVTLMDFYRNDDDQGIYLNLLVPLFDKPAGPRPVGILSLRINPASYLFPYIDRWPTPSRTAETLLLRRDGNDALFLNELKFQKNTSLSLRVPLTSEKTPAVMAAAGRAGIVDGLDYRGVPVIADIRRVPDSPWFLVARMDIAEAFAPLRSRLWMMIGFMAVLLLGTGLGMGWIQRDQKALFYRERLTAVQNLHAVSSRQEALLSAIPDIVMEVDRNKVYVWANHPGLDFFGEEVIGKEAAFYFEGEQDTYKLVSPIFFGRDDVIYVESWQRRKDGEKRLLAWWCRVLKDASGSVSGALSSARDITEQNRAAEALRESERKFRETVKFLDEGYYSASPEGLLLDHNPAFNRILGADPDLDLKGRSLPDFWQNPEDRKSYLDELMAKGTVRNYLVKAKTTSGDKIIILVNSHLVKNVKTGLVRIDGSFIDFTDRQKAEDAVVLQAARMEILLDLHRRMDAPIPEILDFCLESTLKIVQSRLSFIGLMDESESVLTIHAWSKEAMEQCAVDEKPRHFPIAGAGLWGDCVRLRKPVIFNDYDAVLPGKKGCPDGHVSLRRLLCVPVFDGSRIVAVAAAANKETPYGQTDASALTALMNKMWEMIRRKRAEEEILASEERFRNVFEHASVGKSMTRIDGTMRVNDALCRILGYSRDELAELKWMDITHPDDRERDLKIVDSILAGEIPGMDWQKRYIHRSGKTVWVNVSSVLQCDRAGKPQYFITTIIDITEMKRQERELREKNAELTRFAYAVSHDLKSPLVTVKTFLGYLEQDAGKADPQAVAKDLMFIRNATDKMSRLLDELLELSRVGRKTSPAVDVSLQEVVREALNLVAGRIAERGVRVEVTPAPLILTGDRPRLVELFQNLVDNAVKFMGDQPDPCVEIGVVEEGPAPVLFVRDNGIGIDPRHQSRLFGLFEKLDPGTEGTGIGLALVHRIVEVHGGKIRLESAGAGRGSTFYFTLAKTKKHPRQGGSE